MNYRNDARKSLARADEKLNSGNDEDLKYAALELRMVMEALTYERANVYKDEFPPEEYQAWQPRKLMAVLLEIDYRADKDASFAFGIEEEYGVPAPAMRSLGTEKVLNLATIRKHYDALGSYLHVQSLKQIRAGISLDLGKIRSRCEEITTLVREVLSSPIYNIKLGMSSKLECFECGKFIHRRLPHDQEELQAKCHNCIASYSVFEENNRQVMWKPNQHELECANEECNGKITIWHNELKIGAHWTCLKCGGKNTLVFGINYEQEQLSGSGPNNKI